MNADDKLTTADPIPPQDSQAVERAAAWLHSVGEMLREKNRAYGDALTNPLHIFSKSSPEEGIRMHIDEKLSRVFRGDGSGEEDVKKDLVGYIAYLATIGDE